MANERLVEKFMRELMREFILLCHGNDFEKLTLLKIGDTVERLYEKYGSVDAVPVVRCKDCKHSYKSKVSSTGYKCECWGVWDVDCECAPDGFCHKGRRKDDGK